MCLLYNLHQMYIICNRFMCIELILAMLITAGQVFTYPLKIDGELTQMDPCTPEHQCIKWTSSFSSHTGRTKLPPNWLNWPPAPLTWLFFLLLSTFLPWLKGCCYPRLPQKTLPVLVIMDQETHHHPYCVYCAGVLMIGWLL